MREALRSSIDAAVAAFGTLAFGQRVAAGLFALLALLPPLSPMLGGSYLLLTG
jgi:hypothetical protein